MKLSPAMESAKSAQEIKRKGDLRRAAMRDPLVQAALDQFPGAEVVDVTLPDFLESDNAA